MGEHEECARRHAETLLQWQAINTAIYWHVLPSLDLSGVEYERDLRAVNNLVEVVNGRSIADGRGLVALARKNVCVSSAESQKVLVRSLHNMSLKSGSTRAQLSGHAYKMLEIWKLVNTNTIEDRGKLADFYGTLLSSMPVTPEGSHLVGTRTWLANRISDFQAGGASNFENPDDGIAAVLAQAKVLGVEAGDFTAGTGATISYVSRLSPGEPTPSHTS